MGNATWQYNDSKIHVSLLIYLYFICRESARPGGDPLRAKRVFRRADRAAALPRARGQAPPARRREPPQAHVSEIFLLRQRDRGL